jgi:glutaredoxin-like protein
MGMIPEEHREHLKSELQTLEKPVKIVMFTQEFECQYCVQTRKLLEELTGLTDKVKVEVYDFVKDSVKAKDYGVDKVPALVFIGEKDFGIRFYGIPYGYEFQTLIEALKLVSKGQTVLSEHTKEKLKQIKTPVHIQVFVSLTCPFCSMSAVLAYSFAVENDLVKADVVEVGEFLPLSLRYMVMGVPKTVINEKQEFVGALPEDLFLEHVLLATT